LKQLRNLKALAVVFILVVLFTGAMSIMSTQDAVARPRCCFWVFICTMDPPIICWEECIPVRCP